MKLELNKISKKLYRWIAIKLIDGEEKILKSITENFELDLEEQEIKQSLEEAKQKRKEFFDMCQENKKTIIQDRLERREEILEDQNILINRGLNKDNVTNLKRLNAK